MQKNNRIKYVSKMKLGRNKQSLEQTINQIVAYRIKGYKMRNNPLLVQLVQLKKLAENRPHL